MRPIFTFLILIAAFTVRGADNGVLSQRAARAFDAGEWASAHALYLLVSDAEPEAAMPYGRAIFAGLMQGDTSVTAPTVKRALSNHVPLDSVLSVIEAEALSHTDGRLYVAELHRIGNELPYLRRPIDARLLRYYTFRSDAPMMKRYAEALLRGLPDSPQYLNILAKAYLIESDIPAAVATWKRTIAADADNLEALIGLGNALYESDPVEARQYLTRAYTLHPTPYLRALLSK